VTLSAGFSRDSSLIHSGENLDGVGVRRDTRSVELDLSRFITERFKAEAAFSWMRTTYDQGAARTNLNSYRYLTAAPTLTYALDERTSLTLGGDVGRYRSLDGVSSSNSSDLQFGLTRDLSETWSLSAGFGYSRSKNSLNFFFGPFYLGTFQSTQKGTIYSLRLQRKGERLTLSANGSRALRPTGFAYVSRQDIAECAAQYQYSERWSFSAHAQFARNVDPQPAGLQFGRRVYGGDVSASWNWTPDLRISLRGSRYSQRFDSDNVAGGTANTAASNGVALEITRQFGRMDL
jgi:hypothetical protein